MGGTQLALGRWSADPRFYRNRVMRGTVLDIGPGPDPLAKYAPDFPYLTAHTCLDHIPHPSCYGETWVEGRADDLAALPDGATYDLVYSSHCLEHVDDPSAALQAWWSRVKPGGYLLVIVPSWVHYERCIWPPHLNTDHRTAWLLTIKPGGLPFVRGLLNEAHQLAGGVIQRAMTNDAGFDPRNPRDQTGDGSCECGQEIVVWKAA